MRARRMAALTGYAEDFAKITAISFSRRFNPAAALWLQVSQWTYIETRKSLSYVSYVITMQLSYHFCTMPTAF